MSHSPAPWTVDDVGVEVRDANDKSVVWELGNKNPDDWRLIASAPELLAACKHVIAWFEWLKRDQFENLTLGQTLESSYENWERRSEEWSSGSFDMTPLKDAIAKAEGR